MAKARFQLRSNKDVTKSVPIYLVAEHKGKELLKYPTGISITPKQWNKEKKEVRKMAALPYETYNQVLGGLMEVVNRTFAELNAQNIPITGDAVRKALDIHTNKVKTFDGTFLGFIKMYLDKLPAKINDVTGKKMSKQTFSKYKCLYDVVQEIQKKQRRVLFFEHIDIDFYYYFIDFLQIKGFQPNTIGSKYVAPLKTVLLEAENTGVKINKSNWKRYKVPQEETISVYLNENEIQALEQLDLSDNSRLDRVRDLFLFGYYTGQRWGDYSKIKKEMFDDSYIRVRQNKTNKMLMIPYDKGVVNIMDKYNWKLPTISQQNFNDYIKEVCQLANINDKVTKYYQFGAKKEIVQYEKWQLVSSHTARRSFATNMYLRNQNSMLSIMKITGHTTEKSFRKYICFTDEENAEIIRGLQNGKKQPSPLAKVV